MVGLRGRRLIDTVGYAVAVTALICLISALIMVITGTDWFIAEFIMFLAGWVVVAYGLFLLNPDPPWSIEMTDQGGLQVTERTSTSTSPREETRFQRAVQRLPPMTWYPLPPRDRVSPGFKLVLAGVLTLVTSFILERTVVV